jgi:DNA helicase-2/ATP-dependent DNA helicase PcrA
VTDGVPFVTFDDMLYVAAKLLQDYELRARWSSRWDFILQDEVQDESPVQAVIAEALARRHGNYVVVGDTAQCIYAWRGSSPKHLLDFDKTWDCKTIGMHRNYRSGVEIVDLANRIMGKMPRDSVIDIRMTSERGSRSFVSYEVYDTAEAEAEAITGACARMAEEGRPWTDMAVLVRMRRQTRAVETAMHRHRIPVRLVSGSSFFSQPETKTLFGYLRLADGRATKADVASALMFPSRGLGAVFVAAVERALPSCEDDWLKAVRVAASLDPRARVSALSWCALIEDLRKLADKTPYQILDHALTATGYVEWAQRNMEDDEDSVALDNIEEVKNYIADFASLKTLLDEVDAIVASSKRVRKAVTISTIHAAKGQEYPVVFVPGLQGGTFPTPKGDFDEERRVFYVAVTRAMDELWLSRAAAADHGQALRDSHFATEVALSEFVKTEVVGKSGHVATAPTQMELL